MHTRRDPWTLSLNEKTPDGYIALIDGGSEARIVADGFIGTNEIRFDAAEEWLYVVESNAVISPGCVPPRTERCLTARSTASAPTG